MQPLNKTQTVLLELLSKALFQKQVNITVADWRALYKEANTHKVFPCVFEVSKAYVEDEALLAKSAKFARHCVARTVAINYAHCELHRTLSAHHIPYVSFKGLASSLYYPQPELRTAGDVDFYVNPADFEACEAVLKENGYEWVEDGGKHVVYQKNGEFLELHRTLNGIPDNAVGKQIETDVFGDLVQTAVAHRDGQGTVMLPDTFHHGVILLLHTLSHMMKEGIGLRHLCDWAVFASSLSNKTFTALFETKLKAYGLWRFAQVLSLCSVRYLGAPKMAWQGEADETLLHNMMCDIMASGNFGEKDADRKRQIKYVADRGTLAQSESSVLAQASRSISVKAKEQGISKGKVVYEYLKLLLSGKRKPDTAKTLETAAERKALYSEFHLFEINK